MNLKLGRYSKTVTAVVGQALTYLTLYYGGDKWVAIAVAAASAAGVWAVPNSKEPPAPPLPPLPPAGM